MKLTNEQLWSELERRTHKSGWIKRFRIWDCVGSRSRELSAVGLLHGSLQVVTIDQLLSAAHDCDRVAGTVNVKVNPAAWFALAWCFTSNDKVEKIMVILPYGDRLEHSSKYRQQLVIESHSKGFDLAGKLVNQRFLLRTRRALCG